MSARTFHNLNDDRADDYLVVIRNTLLRHQKERGSVVAGGNKMFPLTASAAQAICDDYQSRPAMRGFHVWVIHREDF